MNGTLDSCSICKGRTVLLTGPEEEVIILCAEKHCSTEPIHYPGLTPSEAAIQWNIKQRKAK